MPVNVRAFCSMNVGLLLGNAPVEKRLRFATRPSAGTPIKGVAAGFTEDREPGTMYWGCDLGIGKGFEPRSAT